jgi:hypothetical protein
MPSFLKLRKNWGHFHRAHHLSAMAGHQVASSSRILSLPRGTSLEGENLTSVMDPGLAQTIPHGIPCPFTSWKPICIIKSKEKINKVTQGLKLFSNPCIPISSPLM